MSDYRRWYVPGGTYFFTAVTHNRRPILCDELARKCLHKAIETVRKRRPIELVSIVLLPDHIHTIWTLPQGDAAYPLRWKRIKEEFTLSYLVPAARKCRRAVPFAPRRARRLAAAILGAHGAR